MMDFSSIRDAITDISISIMLGSLAVVVAAFALFTLVGIVKDCFFGKKKKKKLEGLQP